METGFQLIVQLAILNQAHKLYVNQTTTGYASTSVKVEESGVYIVSIIPIMEETGIINSDVEHKELILVDSVTTTSGKFNYYKH